MSEDVIELRAALQTDLDEIVSIYNYYVEESIVTFDMPPFDKEVFKQSLSDVLQKYPFIVALNEGKVCGYSYAGPWKTRRAYNATVESSVYLKQGFEKRGIGGKLYEKLIEQLRQKSIRAVIAGISLPNNESVSFHEKFGFKHVGTFREVGFKFEKWIDVGYWQLTIK